MKQDAAHYVEEQKKIIALLKKQRDALLDVCKDGIKFVNSLPASCCSLSRENRTVFHGMLIDIIALVEKEG